MTFPSLVDQAAPARSASGRRSYGVVDNCAWPPPARRPRTGREAAQAGESSFMEARHVEVPVWPVRPLRDPPVLMAVWCPQRRPAASIAGGRGGEAVGRWGHTPVPADHLTSTPSPPHRAARVLAEHRRKHPWRTPADSSSVRVLGCGPSPSRSAGSFPATETAVGPAATSGETNVRRGGSSRRPRRAPVPVVTVMMTGRARADRPSCPRRRCRGRCCRGVPFEDGEHFLVEGLGPVVTPGCG